MFRLKLTFRNTLLVLFALLIWTGCKKRTVELNPNNLVDERDGKRYLIVQYGNQWWMAQNLDYKLPGSLQNPNNPLTDYGRLYTWEQAKIACPSGWHLPTDAEWQTMEYTNGMALTELNSMGYRGGLLGFSMKSRTGWAQNNGSNSMGFNAFPAGIYNYTTNSYEELGHKANFWTASDSSAVSVWYRGFTKDYEGFYRYAKNKQNSYSCRCVRD